MPHTVTFCVCACVYIYIHTHICKPWHLFNKERNDWLRQHGFCTKFQNCRKSLNRKILNKGIPQLQLVWVKQNSKHKNCLQILFLILENCYYLCAKITIVYSVNITVLILHTLKYKNCQNVLHFFTYNCKFIKFIQNDELLFWISFAGLIGEHKFHCLHAIYWRLQTFENQRVANLA